jgi:hypothetical protein
MRFLVELTHQTICDLLRRATHQPIKVLFCGRWGGAFYRVLGSTKILDHLVPGEEDVLQDEVPQTIFGAGIARLDDDLSENESSSR